MICGKCNKDVDTAYSDGKTWVCTKCHAKDPQRPTPKWISFAANDKKGGFTIKIRRAF